MNSAKTKYFLQPDAAKLCVCPLCDNFLGPSAVILSCQHTVCQSCIQDLCPACGEQVTSSVAIPGGFFSVVVSKPVKCTHTGCSWQGALGMHGEQLTQHLDHCMFKPWKCNDCGVVLAISEQLQHEEECDMFKIACRYECGVHIPRQEETKHASTCDWAPVQCEFEHIGCKHILRRKDQNDHATNPANVNRHMLLLLQEVQRLRHGLSTLAANFTHVNQENVEPKSSRGRGRGRPRKSAQEA